MSDGLQHHDLKNPEVTGLNKSDKNSQNPQTNRSQPKWAFLYISMTYGLNSFTLSIT